MLLLLLVVASIWLQDSARAIAAEAERLFARGVELFETRRRDALLESAGLFERASQPDETHALAFAGLASSRCLLALYSVVPPAEALPGAREAAQTALRLQPDMAAPYAALGLVEYLYDWHWRRAEELFRTGIEKDPSYAEVRHWYGMLLMARGRFPEAVQAMDRALALDPGARIIHVKRGTVLAAAGRFAEAEAQLRRSVERFPEMALPWRELGFLSLPQGRREDAVEAFEHAAELSDPVSKSSSSLAYAYAVVGRRQEARQILDVFLRRVERRVERRVQRRVQVGFVPPIDLARIYLGLGESATALTWLETALETHDPGLVYLAIRPDFASLRGEPRFEKILARVGLE